MLAVCGGTRAHALGRVGSQHASCARAARRQKRRPRHRVRRVRPHEAEVRLPHTLEESELLAAGRLFAHGAGAAAVRLSLHGAAAAQPGAKVSCDYRGLLCRDGLCLRALTN